MPIGAFRLNTVSKLIAEATVIYARTAKTVTANGNAQVSTAQSKFGGASALLDGTGDYLAIPYSADFAYGTGDWTIEFWIRFNALSVVDNKLVWEQRPAATNGAYPTIYITTAQKIIYYANSANRCVGTTTLVINTWYHIAVSRSGTNTRLFVNGVQEGSTYSDSTNYLTNTTEMRIGQSFDGSYPDNVNGYLDEIRVSNTARYTSNFTPLSIPFVNDNKTLLLIHADGTNASTTFTDDNVSHRRPLTMFGDAQVSTAQSQFSGSSMLFDGTGDYLLTRLNLDTTFTFECWIRLANVSGEKYVFRIHNSSDTFQYVCGVENNYMYVYAGGITTGGTLVTNTWYHLAFVRNSSDSISLWLNGTNVASRTVGTDLTDAMMFIGGYTNNLGVNGYLDEIRVSNTARYTGNFTPSTTPFEPDANTLLLIHGDGTGLGTQVYNDVYAPPAVGHQSLSVIPYGTAKISTAQSKFGGSSLLISSSTDRLELTSLPLGSGNWTMECWFRANTLSGDDNLIEMRTGSDTAPTIYVSGGTLYYAIGFSNIITGSSLSTNTWYHVAVSKSGTSTKLFLNGTQVGSTYTDNNTYVNNGPLIIGNYFGKNAAMDGYQDDIRISNTARYTANFTPSTVPFQSDANTLVLLDCDGENNSTRFVDDGSNPVVLDDVVIHASATSTASTITIPAAAATGDYAILFDTSTTVTNTIPSGWTSINGVTTTGIRTNISYKRLVSGDPNTSVTGMAGTTRKVMLIIKGNSDLLSNTLSTPGSQATTAVPTNQTISTSNVNTPAVFFAAYASTGAITTRGWSGGSPSEYSSFSTSGIYVKALVYGRGTTPATATISMSDGGTNTLQSFSMKFA